MGEAFVVEGADDSEVVGVFGDVGEEIGDVDAGLSVLAEFAAGREDGAFLEGGELEADVAEGIGDALAFEFGESGFGVEGVEVAGAAMHEQGDHAFGGGGHVRGFGRQGIGGGVAGGEVLGEHPLGGDGAEAEACAAKEFAAAVLAVLNRHKGTR